MPAAYPVPALEQLRQEIDEMAPLRSTASDGWLGDAAHAARHSDHNPEPDGSVDARDFTHDPAHGVDCNLLSDQIKDDRRVSYIIWNRRIWNPSISRTWRTYTGTNPHDHHMHVSVTDAGQNDTSLWLAPRKDPNNMFDKQAKEYLDAKFKNRREAELDILAGQKAILEAVGGAQEAIDRIDKRTKVIKAEVQDDDG